jgi:hypothetical protein
MEWNLTGTNIPHPSEVGQTLRELAPEICKSFDTISRFQEYLWGEKELKEVRIHPRLEQVARHVWCNPPPYLMWDNVIQAPSFILFVDPIMPEHEMHLVYLDGKKRIIKLD